MHYLHTVVWLLDRLAAGDGVAWLVVVVLVLVLGVCVLRDLRAKKGTRPATRQRNDSTRPPIPN
jgi:hypothetical protein